MGSILAPNRPHRLSTRFWMLPVVSRATLASLGGDASRQGMVAGLPDLLKCGRHEPAVVRQGRSGYAGASAAPNHRSASVGPTDHESPGRRARPPLGEFPPSCRPRGAPVSQGTTGVSVRAQPCSGAPTASQQVVGVWAANLGEPLRPPLRLQHTPWVIVLTAASTLLLFVVGRGRGLRALPSPDGGSASTPPGGAAPRHGTRA
jgi:hypothetical protein